MSAELVSLFEEWKAWSVGADSSENGWETDFPGWRGLIDAAEHAMKQELTAESAAVLAECWSADQEDEALLTFASEHLDECWEALQVLGNSSLPGCRWQVYEALSHGGKRAENTLRKGLSDPDAYARRRALLTLAKLRPSDAQAIAESFLADPDPYLRQAALEMVLVSADPAFRRNSKEDLESPEALRAAFERERPHREPSKGPFRPTDEEKKRIQSFSSFVRSAVTAFFGAEPATEPKAFGAWSPLQKTLLEEIAKTPFELHHNAKELGDILERSGAILVGGADDDRYLSRYVGLRPVSALETEVDGRPLWLGLRLRLMGKVSREEVLAATKTLETPARFDLARRALDNAYQLMRRWPLPRNITREIERDDAARLDAEMLALIESVPTNELETELSREVASPKPLLGWVVVLSLALVTRGAELPRDLDAKLGNALEISTSESTGRDLLRALPAARRRTIVSAIELTPYNVDGWVYLDLLSPSDQAELVTLAFSDFLSAVSTEVVPYVSALVKGFDASAQKALRDVAARGGPNKTLLTEILASSN